MANLFLSLAASSLLLLGSCSNEHSQGSGSSLSVEAFAHKMKQLPDAPVIDVRTPEEFSKGHLQNATNIDWNGNDFGNGIARLDKSKPVLVYCLSGGRSAAAASKMRAEGFKEVYEMEGGMMKWRAAGMPETTDTQNKAIGMTKAQFDTLTGSKPMVLVDFYADWCTPCKKMKPYLDEIGETMAGKVTLVRINADNNPQLCKEMGIDGLPVLQLYSNHKMTWTHTGYIDKETVMKQLQ